MYAVNEFKYFSTAVPINKIKTCPVRLFTLISTTLILDIAVHKVIETSGHNLLAAHSNIFAVHNNCIEMCATQKDEKPNLLFSVLKNKCPRCRRGNMYQEKNPYHLKRFMKMNGECPVCGQPLDMEPGFYYGTNMVSYALAVLISVLSFFLWWAVIGLSLKDNRFFWWLGLNATLLVLLQPPLMRLSRSVWIVFFVPYSSQWKEGDVVAPERLNKDQMGNW